MEAQAPYPHRIASRERVLKSHTTRLETRSGTAFITLTNDADGEPFEVFLNLGKAGSETFAAAEALGRLISLALRLSSPLSRTERAQEIAGQLSHIGSGAFSDSLPSISDALSKAIVDALNGQPQEPPDLALAESETKLPADPPLPLPLNVLQHPQTNSKHKGKEMNNPQMILNPDLYQASQKLADSVRQATPIAAYLYAKDRMESDPTAKSLLERFASAQAELRVRQSTQSVTQEQMDHLRALQSKIRSNRLIVEYAETQQAAIAYLPSINQEISGYIGIDFASLAGSASC
jgi:cell fate (sporulation/competence/biofilm development) regulator YlbF (YheA/YmcA/DUF963 family)